MLEHKHHTRLEYHLIKQIIADLKQNLPENIPQDAMYLNIDSRIIHATYGIKKLSIYLNCDYIVANTYIIRDNGVALLTKAYSILISKPDAIEIISQIVNEHLKSGVRRINA